ncbi:hypothetical protein BJ165DRAFT_1583641 [Panaeolus papilionaceus]|nr:hypothetical protein BJ165DRAFT_1583641 [Panaeolus papilionaceus]
MKLLIIFALCTCFGALSSAIPVPVNQTGPKIDKGKANLKAIEKAEDPISRPVSPTPFTDQKVPLPGRSGIYHNSGDSVTTAYYGDDKIPEHNRANALRGIPSGGFWRGTEDGRNRDEKQIAMLYNPNHAMTTTVEYVPSTESIQEGNLLSKLSSTMKKEGSLGQLRPSRGWSDLDPNQRIAHEAPVELSDEHNFRAGPPLEEKKPNTIGFRKSKPLKPVPDGTHHRPGRVAPPGHVWHPPAKLNDLQHATHVGAPMPPPESDKRYPPRPQDYEHYRQQYYEAQMTQARQQAALSRGPPKSSIIEASRSQGSPSLVETTPSFQAQMESLAEQMRLAHIAQQQQVSPAGHTPPASHVPPNAYTHLRAADHSMHVSPAHSYPAVPPSSAHYIGGFESPAHQQPYPGQHSHPTPILTPQAPASGGHQASAQGANVLPPHEVNPEPRRSARIKALKKTP